MPIATPNEKVTEASQNETFQAMITATPALIATPLRRPETPVTITIHAAETETRNPVALTPVTPRRAPAPVTTHMLAPFVAHIIATYYMLPQTRAHNRAEPADAVTAYDDAISRIRPGFIGT